MTDEEWDLTPAYLRPPLDDEELTTEEELADLRAYASRLTLIPDCIRERIQLLKSRIERSKSLTLLRMKLRTAGKLRDYEDKNRADGLHTIE